MADRVVVDQQQNKINDGYAFVYSDVITLDAGGVKEYILVPNQSHYPHIKFDIVGCSGETQFRLFENPSTTWTVTGSGTSASMTAGSTCSSKVANRNRPEAKSAGLGISGVLACPAAAAASGTQIYYTQIGSAGVYPISLNRPEWILGGTTGYWIQLKSNSAKNAIALNIEWYEE